MDQLRLPAALEGAERILVAGAGGGFDVYARLPIYERLRSLGKPVVLTNLSFTYMGGTTAKYLGGALYAVEPDTQGGDDYFPERARGDECGLGTPAEDATSLAAVSLLPTKTKIVTCVGFGIDAFHGVSHSRWLENVAGLTKEGAFLGAIALRREMPEMKMYLEAVDHADAATPTRPSIVNGSIASAALGEFGDHHRSDRTKNGTLFINPLMTLLWAFDLDAVARRNHYLRALAHTESIWDVQTIIEAFHKNATKRPSIPFPH